MIFVKTADLRGRRTTGWSFCRGCFGNKVDAEWRTLGDDGEVCERCDGSGTVWILAEKSEGVVA